MIVAGEDHSPNQYCAPTALEFATSIKIDALRRVLADEPMQPAATQRFEIERALAYGHVAAALGTLRRIGLDQILPRRPERQARLITAMIVARVVEPAAKLATARQLERHHRLSRARRLARSR